VTANARLQLLRARGMEAAQHMRLAPSPEPQLAGDWRPPRCPARPDEHAAAHVGAELWCLWCGRVWDSDGRGGWALTPWPANKRHVRTEVRPSFALRGGM
jgi:hypothetical protein